MSGGVLAGAEFLGKERWSEKGRGLAWQEECPHPPSDPGSLLQQHRARSPGCVLGSLGPTLPPADVTWGRGQVSSPDSCYQIPTQNSRESRRFYAILHGTGFLMLGRTELMSGGTEHSVFHSLIYNFFFQ